MSKLKPDINLDDHHLGNTNATVTLVEFGDYECPHCGHAHPLIKKLIKEMGQNVHFVFRNFPLKEIHPHAYMAALAAEAAAKQNKFWEMHYLIFENQDKLNKEFLMSLAKHLRLDIEQFKKDYESAAVQDKVEADFESGVRSGVNGTPSFYVNGYKILTYDESYESLVDAIRERLE
jgi:protein-disulfide isomerase